MRGEGGEAKLCARGERRGGGGKTLCQRARLIGTLFPGKQLPTYSLPPPTHPPTHPLHEVLTKLPSPPIAGSSVFGPEVLGVLASVCVVAALLGAVIASSVCHFKARSAQRRGMNKENMSSANATYVDARDSPPESS